MRGPTANQPYYTSLGQITDLPSGRKAIAIATGSTHNVVLLDDLTVWTGGYGPDGQRPCPLAAVLFGRYLRCPSSPTRAFLTISLWGRGHSLPRQFVENPQHTHLRPDPAIRRRDHRSPSGSHYRRRIAHGRAPLGR